MEYHRQAKGAADVAPEQRRRDEKQQHGGPQPTLQAGVPHYVEGPVDGDEHRQEDRCALDHDQTSRPMRASTAAVVIVPPASIRTHPKALWGSNYCCRTSAFTCLFAVRP